MSGLLFIFNIEVNWSQGWTIVVAETEMLESERKGTWKFEEEI